MGPAAEPAIPALIEALDNPKLQDAACLALGSIGNSAQASMPRLIELYRAGKLNRAFLIAVRGIGPAAQEAVPDMIKLLRVPEEDSNFVQHGLKECFASIGPDACAALAEMLRDPDPGNRRRAAIVLEQMGAGAAPAVTALMASLDDTAARDWAAAALGRIGPEAELAIPALIRLLESDDFTVRVCAARALGEIGPASESAVPSLTTLLHDRELRVRVAADEALHRIEKREATDSQ
jgi:HEAT repeat protein